MTRRRPDTLTLMTWAFFILFLVCLVPIVTAGQYAHPLYDDYR